MSLSPSGQLLGAVPFLAAGTDGQSPPGAAQTVTLSAGGAVVGVAEAAFTVTPLAPAPGSTAALGEALADVGVELERIADALAPEPGAEEQWTMAVAGALAELVNGDDPHSLSSAFEDLAASDPAILALLDAYLAGSGILERTEDLLAGLAALAVPIERDTTVIDDVVLARKMQFYVIAKLFGETVVHETAEEYAYTVGLATGLIGIGADVPGAAIVGAVIAVADFAVNKVLLGVLPATVTDFTLTLEDPDLLLGETTDARVDLTAVNAPPGVGIQDFVGLTLNLLGLGASGQTETFAQILESTASFYLATVQQLLSTYSDAHPELGLDISVNLVPPLAWSTTIHDPRLVDCLSYAPAVVDGLDDAVNWRAGTTQLGAGDIYARIAVGSEAQLLDLPPGFEYSGGAFGENVLATETVTVSVTGTLVMELQLDSVIEPGQTKPLTVHAGYAVPGGQPLWSPGLHVDVAAEGGTVDPAEGDTGGDGSFFTLVTLDEGSTEVLISVTVSDDLFNAVTETVSAGTSPASTLRVAWSTLTGLAGGLAEAGPPSDNGDQHTEQIDVALSEAGPVSGSASGAGHDTADGGGTADGSGSMAASGSATVAGNVLSIDASFTGSRSASYSLPQEGTWALASGGARAKYETLFAIETEADLVSADVSLTATGSLGETDGLCIAIFRRSGGTTYAAIPLNGSWSGTLVLPGTYTLSLELNPSPLQVNSAVDGLPGASRQDGVSASVHCTVTLN
ncbi:hypothetical protein KDL67_11225 [bacterium]|nr:hypothetical protein [bacterium]